MFEDGGPAVARVAFARPMMGPEEREAVATVIGFNTLTNGGIVRMFEERFTDWMGGGLAVAVSSCTAALHIACLALFKPGDEVIVPALTHISTANAVEAMGAKPVFADCDIKTGNVSRETIEPLITARTAGIIVVHYLGRLCDMGDLRDLCRKHELRLIEDCALALGAHDDSRHAGSFGDVGCFSFYPAKHITTCEGGMMTCRDPSLAEKFRAIRQFGQTKRHGDAEVLGLNYRMTELQAAIGLKQLPKLPLFLKRREANYNALAAHFPDRINTDRGAFYALSIFVPDDLDRDEIKHRASVKQIETSVYYPRPVPLYTYYRCKYGYAQGGFPNAERVSCRTICLPVGPHLKKRHLIYMTHVIKQLIRSESPSSAAPDSSATISLAS